MNKQFVTYEIALKLKELGFDEDCLGWYFGKDHKLIIGDVKSSQLIGDAIIAPLCQQVIDFLREHYKYNITYNVLDHNIDTAYVFKGGSTKSKFKILSKSSDFYIARERAIANAISRILLNN